MEKIYRCEQCRREFSTEEECMEHEKTHKNPSNMLWRVTGELCTDKNFMVRVEPVPRGNPLHADPAFVLAGSESWWVNCKKPDILTALQSLNAVVRENLRKQEEALAQRRKDFEETMGAMMEKYMNGGKQK